MAQIDKNTVSAENQLKENEYIKFYGSGTEKKILFVGNSITRHGVKEEIGWYWDFGMAASCEDKDYVHLVMSEMNKKYNASYCVCQAGQWEINYTQPEEALDFFTDARDFCADTIIVRLIENVDHTHYNDEIFRKNYPELIKFLNKSGKAKIIVTDGFWRHPADSTIKEIAQIKGYDFVTLGDLGELDEMKAIGLFAHDGVAQHPGDLGMENIAKRILGKLL
ncbi:MAG: SGNH/GDSL hydrolase family protein [Clostridia bacterium]|nr:SGNH/GDSL hydrolase family protein [Clostridia bacterium]